MKKWVVFAVAVGALVVGIIVWRRAAQGKVE
jgi:hypothetical protein